MANDETIGACAIDGMDSAGSASMASLERIGECNLEPMETVDGNSCASSQVKHLEVEDVDDKKLEDKDGEGHAKEEPPVHDVVMKESERKEEDEDLQLSTDDLFLLCDLFYLPFEHGPVGMQLLQEFSWLKRHAHVVAGNQSKNSVAANFPPEVRIFWSKP